MQKTPFPGHWELMPTYQLQEAEFNLFRLRQQHYHEQATTVGDYKPGKPVSRVLLYSWEDAQQIIAHWRSKMDYAEFIVIGHCITN